MSKPSFGIGIFGTEPIQKIVSYVKLAEELGYNSAWIIDSQLVCREAYVTLTACALNTRRIKLGTGVTNPYTRHASVTASAFATLSEIASGRLLMGISIGNSSVRTLGVEPQGVNNMAEYINKVRSLLRNQPVKFEGEVEGRITWLDKSLDIPIYVAGSGEKVIRAGGRLADGVILLTGPSDYLLDRGIGYAKEGAVEAGRDPSGIDLVYQASTSIAQDRNVAREHVRALVTLTLRLARPETFAENEEDLHQIRRIYQDYDYSKHAVADPAHRALAPDKFIDVLALAGTPEDVREKVKQILKRPEIKHIVINPHESLKGLISIDSIIKDFAEHVMSHVAQRLRLRTSFQPLEEEIPEVIFDKKAA